MVPIFSVISYIFDFHLLTSANSIILIGTILLLVFFVGGLLVLLLQRDKYERRLKPSYQQEFTIILGVSALGVLGLGIMFMFFGGSPFYVPHVIIPTGIGVYTFLYIIGNRYFNVSLLRRTKK
jgi:hypothetical protein